MALKIALVLGFLVAVGLILTRFSGARMSKEQVQALLDEGAIVVDVRTPAEFSGGHVPQAVNIPVDQIDRNKDELMAKSRPVILYCKSGMRSGVAQSKLKAAGLERVYNLGPMSAWPL